MSNNSWKQYGGIAKMEEYNVINANTIVAEQFVSRSTKPIYQFLNGTFEVSNDLSAANNIITSNSFYCFVDTTVNNNLYANQKLFFGSGTFEPISSNLPSDSTHAFMYGDASFIGVNIKQPNTIFHITSNVPEETNILLVESSNNYIRNILAQNKNDRGVVLDADDTSANFFFHLDSSTNKLNDSDANITYTIGGNLSTSVSNEFIVHSKFNNIHALENITFDSSGGYVLDTSGSSTFIDRNNANIIIDTSGTYSVHSHENYSMTTNSDMNVQAIRGNINIDANKTNYQSLFNISHATRGISGENFNQLLTVYDISNIPFLPNMYDISGALTGNSIVGIAKDSSSNTFIRLSTGGGLLGAAYGGGAFPNDTSRSMNVIGVNDACGNYLHNQIMVSNNSKEKYVSTLGINTFSPQSDQYTVDINGPVRISNGEIQTMVEANFEFKSVEFSKINPLYGIAVGTPSTLTDDLTNPIYNQFTMYTSDGGINWNLSNNVYGTTNFNQTRVNFLSSFMYDINYIFIVGEKSYVYYSNDSGKNWYRANIYGDLLFRDQTNIIGAVHGGNIRFFIPYKYSNEATSQIDSYTKQIRYFDLTIADLATTLNGGDINSITSSEISLDIDITCSTSTTTQVFFAGSGIAIFNIDLTGVPIYLLQSYTFHDILAVNDNLIIAVGDNVISYSEDSGANWTSVNISTETLMSSNLYNVSNIVLKSIFARNENTLVVVGDDGIFGFSKNGPAKENWDIVPNSILNSSGIAERINGVNNSLLDIHMNNDDSMIISNVVANSVNDEVDNKNDILGHSKVQHIFIPALFNRLQNKIMDICGNINITGDVDLLDGDLSVSSTSRLFVNYIDGNPDGSLPNSKNLMIGENTQIISIGKVDPDDRTKGVYIEESSYNYINIGSVQPDVDMKPYFIQLGNSGDTKNHDVSQNKIVVGGATDEIVFGGGGFSIKSEAELLVTNKIIRVNNDAPNENLSAQAGLYIHENYGSGDINPSAGFVAISDDRRGFNFKPTIKDSHIVTLETEDMSLNFNNPFNTEYGINEIQNGLMVLTKSSEDTGGDYSITVKPVDLSNILIRDSNASDQEKQYILTKLAINDDLYLNNRMFVNSDVSFNTRIYVRENSIFEGDVSINQNLFIGKDLTIDGNLIVEQYRNETIINTTTTEYLFLSITEDLSLNGRLFVRDDASFNSNLYVKDKIGINNHAAIISLDISATDAVRIPVGTTIERDLFTHQTGQIRFNTSNSQFEGYNNSGAWQGLGGVIDVDQNTFILAESAPTKDENQLRFFTADYNIDSSLMRPRLQMILDASNGGLAIGHSIASDISNNLYNPPSDGLTVSGDISMNSSAYVANRLGISTHGAVVALDMSTNDALKIPVGISGERPILSTDYYQGFIRFNKNILYDGTGDYTYEGSFGVGEWKPLGQHWKGVIDTDGDTFITAEDSFGMDGDDLKFYTKDNLRMTIDQSGNLGYGIGPVDDISFNIKGTTRIDGNLNIDNNVTIGMDLSVNQNVTVGMDVSMNADLFVTKLQSRDTATGIIDLGSHRINYDNIYNIPTTDRNIESVPQGGIIMWTNVNNIPYGFIICDGGQATSGVNPPAGTTDLITTIDVQGVSIDVPDLRSKFVVGYDTRDTSFNIPGYTNGSSTITLDNLPAHTHSVTTNDQTVDSSSFALNKTDNLYDHDTINQFGSAEATVLRAENGVGTLGSTVAASSDSITGSSTVVGGTITSTSVGSGTKYYPPYYTVVFIIRYTTALSTDQQLLGVDAYYVPNRLGIGTTVPLGELHISLDMDPNDANKDSSWHTDVSNSQLLIAGSSSYHRFAIGYDTTLDHAFMQGAYHDTGINYRNISMQLKGGSIGIGTTVPIGHAGPADTNPGDNLINLAVNGDVSGDTFYVKKMQAAGSASVIDLGNHTISYANLSDIPESERNIESVPVGGIIMWSAANIPDGFYICDGGQETSGVNPPRGSAEDASPVKEFTGLAGETIAIPDLRSRFVIGHDTRDLSFDAVGNTGGSVAISSDQLPSHSHYSVENHSVDSVDYYLGQYNSVTTHASGGNYIGVGIPGTSMDNAYTTSSVGSNKNFSPPYYVLRFLIRYSTPLTADTQVGRNVYNVPNRLGIGTQVPMAEIHIAHDIQVTSSAVTTDWPTDISNSQLLLSGLSATGLNDRFALGYDNTADYAFLQAANHEDSSVPISKNISMQPKGGNVGIGTTTPDKTLEVAGDMCGTTLYVNSLRKSGASELDTTATLDLGNHKINYNNIINIPTQDQNIESVPVGGVIMWGDPGTIPTGFYLCDGGASHGVTSFTGINNTPVTVPDLRSKFVIGYHDSDATFGTIGNTGGSATIAETNLPAHTHTYSGNVNADGTHNHGTGLGPSGESSMYYYGLKQSGISAYGNPSIDVNYDSTFDAIIATSTEGSHSHSFSGTTDTGSGSGTDYYQPYYVLMFLIRYTTPLTSDVQLYGQNVYYVPNRLGIGNTSPLAEIHISKTISVPADDSVTTAHWHTDVSNSQLLLTGGSNDSGTKSRLALGYENTADYAFLQAAEHTNDTTAVAKHIVLQPNGGFVGIGTTSPTYTLEVNGDMQATSYNATSDVRLKTNIQTIQNSIHFINRLQGISYSWIEDIDNTSKVNYGLIAQDVENVLPEVVHTSNTIHPKHGFCPKSIEYNQIIPHLIESIKTLSEEKTILRQELDIMKSENESMKEKMKQYDTWFAQLLNK